MSQGKSFEWTPELIDKVKALFKDEIPISAIGREIGCGETTVGKLTRKLGLRRRRPNKNRIIEAAKESRRPRSVYLSTDLTKDDPGLKVVDCRLSVIAQDESFQQAMKIAIRMGLERAPIGIIKDNSPFSPKAFYRPQILSSCSSPAGWLAELGGGDGSESLGYSHRRAGAQ